MTALNKVDRLDRPRTVKALAAAAELGVDGEIFPISARTRRRGGAARPSSIALLPEGPFLYPPEEQQRPAASVRLAELVREQVLLRTREELPHAVEVEIDELEEREDGLLVVRARVWAETESQKGILVGAGGRMVKAVGTRRARDRARCSAAASTSTCTCACARAGAATRRCSTGSDRMSSSASSSTCAASEEAIVDDVRPRATARRCSRRACRWCGS